MFTKRQNIVDIPLDEYIAKMNITSTPSSLPESLEGRSEPSDHIQQTLCSDSDRTESKKQESSSVESSLSQKAKPKVSLRHENPDLQRDAPVRYRQPRYQSSASIDARNRIQQRRNRRRFGHRFFIEQPEESVGPSRPSITPPSSMQRQAVVMSGPSWEQMLPYEQLQQMATSAYLLSTFFNLAPPPPFNDPALFRR